MTQKTRVVRNRIYIDDRVYDAKALGGGKFSVSTSAGTPVGTFQIRGRAVEAEDLGVADADPLEQIGLLWVGENLSPMPGQKPASAAAAGAAAPPPAPPPAPAPTSPEPAPPAPAPPPAAATAPAEAITTSSAPTGRVRSICRVAAHNPPDAATLAKAMLYHAWLREQAGVVSSQLSREPKTGKIVSVTVWATEEQYVAMRYLKPPQGTSPLQSVSVDVMEVVG